jgi:hypothetical protein
LGTPFPLSYNVVALAERGAQRLVLKLGVPSAELTGEIDSLEQAGLILDELEGVAVPRTVAPTHGSARAALLLHADFQRGNLLLRWAFVGAMLSCAWAFEEGEPPEEHLGAATLMASALAPSMTPRSQQLTKISLAGHRDRRSVEMVRKPGAG